MASHRPDSQVFKNDASYEGRDNRAYLEKTKRVTPPLPLGHMFLLLVYGQL